MPHRVKHGKYNVIDPKTGDVTTYKAGDVVNKVPKSHLENFADQFELVERETKKKAPAKKKEEKEPAGAETG